MTPASSAVQFTVKPRLTVKRRPRSGRYVENPSFTGFVSRAIRALGRRVGQGDVEALPELVALSEQLDSAIADAVTGLRASGYSWSEIAARLGVTKQAAHHRYGRVTR